VQLPQGAVVIEVEAHFFDNTVNNFGICEVRLRRRNFNLTGNENVAARDFTPSGTASNAIKKEDIPVTASRATIDNNTYQYWVHLELNANPTDSNLRFYGFRIEYTLDTLRP
jgi:hypothetical protein